MSDTSSASHGKMNTSQKNEIMMNGKGDGRKRVVAVEI
jgi:hypothetical protein